MFTDSVLIGHIVRASRTDEGDDPLVSLEGRLGGSEELDLEIEGLNGDREDEGEDCLGPLDRLGVYEGPVGLVPRLDEVERPIETRIHVDDLHVDDRVGFSDRHDDPIERVTSLEDVEIAVFRRLGGRDARERHLGVVEEGVFGVADQTDLSQRGEGVSTLSGELGREELKVPSERGGRCRGEEDSHVSGEEFLHLEGEICRERGRGERTLGLTEKLENLEGTVDSPLTEPIDQTDRQPLPPTSREVAPELEEKGPRLVSSDPPRGLEKEFLGETTEGVGRGEEGTRPTREGEQFEHHLCYLEGCPPQRLEEEMDGGSRGGGRGGRGGGLGLSKELPVFSVVASRRQERRDALDTQHGVGISLEVRGRGLGGGRYSGLESSELPAKDVEIPPPTGFTPTQEGEVSSGGPLTSGIVCPINQTAD
jgi:hypothetical protein